MRLGRKMAFLKALKFEIGKLGFNSFPQKCKMHEFFPYVCSLSGFKDTGFKLITSDHDSETITHIFSTSRE